MPLFGPPNIGRLKAKRNIKGLIDALAYKKDAVIRAQAATAFREVWDAAAIQPLMNATKDVDDQVVLAAVTSLKEANDPLVFDGLLKLATDLVCRARAMIVFTLGQKQDSRAVEPLIQVLRTDPDPNVRQLSVEALQLIGNAESIDAIVLATRDPIDDVMHSAIKALEQSPNPQAFERLLEMMSDATHPRKGYIAVALGRKRDVRAVESLVAALKYDPVPIVRYCALWALQQIGSTSMTETIVAATMDSDDKVMEAAIQALNQSTDPLAIDRLLEILSNNSHRARSLVIQILSKRQEKRAIEPIVRILKTDPDKSLQRDSAKALEWMHWEPQELELKTQFWTLLEREDRLVELGDVAIQSILDLIASGRNLNLAILVNAKNPISVKSRIKLFSIYLGIGKAVRESTFQECEKLLEIHSSSADTQDLLKITNIKQGSIVKMMSKTCVLGENDSFEHSWEETKISDFSRLKQLARQELVRRGENI